jgi:hypothetical protein
MSGNPHSSKVVPSAYGRPQLVQKFVDIQGVSNPACHKFDGNSGGNFE